LKIVLNISPPKNAVEFVLLSAAANVAATITPQHLLLNRNDLLVGGVHVHSIFTCIKRNTHQQALRDIVTAKCQVLFWVRILHRMKSTAKNLPAVDCYSAWSAIRLLCSSFLMILGCLRQTEGFAGHHGAVFMACAMPVQLLWLWEEWRVPDE
jgi:dihydroorotase